MPGGGFPLEELRAAVLSSADWAPTQSTTFVAELDRFLWQAARRLVTLTPSLLQTTERMWIQPLLQNAALAADRLRVVAGDPLVLERPATTGRTAWYFNGIADSWNLWVTTTSNVVHRFKAHEFWTDQETGYERVSLDKPYPATAETGMTWKLWQDPYPLPPDVVSIVDVRRFHSNGGGGFYTLRGLTERQLEERQLATGWASGNEPFYWSRGQSVRRQPPRKAPTVTNAGTWDAGGDDTGTFEYCYTYCWGIRDLDAVDPHGNYDPAWESPPSPVSGQATSTAGGGGAITIAFPAPDYIAHYTGLPTAGSARAFRSGYTVRLYARRVSDTETPVIDELSGFHLLAVVDATPGSYVHDGTAQLVYERPLSAQPVVPTIRVWPRTTQRMELDLRVVKPPMPLTVAADVIPVPHEVVQVVILDARRRLAEKMGQHAIAQDIQLNQIPRAVAAALGAYETDGALTLIRGECDVPNDNPRGYDIDELESLLYGYRS